MNLAVSIGNSQVKVASFEEKKIIGNFSFSSQKSYTSDELYAIFKIFGITDAEDAVIASVVPSLCSFFYDMLKKKFGIKAPLRITPNLKTGIKFSYKDPQSLGEDRIANIVGASKTYSGDLAVIDFGTAIAVDFITKDKNHLGGMIIPGISSSLANLIASTSRLFNIEIKKPEKYIGQTTQECMESGIYLSIIGLLDAIKAASKQETNIDFIFLATGGESEIIGKFAPVIKIIDPDLVLKGLMEIYYLNR